MAEIFDFNVELDRRSRIGGTTVPQGKQCEHDNLTIEAHGHIVRCDDCGEQVDAFWVLERMAYRREREIQKREAEKAELEDLRHKTIHLKAARRVERLWRGRKMAPCCPHCDAAILPEDGLGSNAVNRDIELRRRAKSDAGGKA